MNCNCINDIEKRIRAHMQPQAGADCTVTATSTAMMLTDDMGLKSVLQVPFCVKGPKKGFSSAKGKTMGCNVNICPFCGRPAGRYVVGEDAGLSAAMPGVAA
ncbi:MAG: hypothetical protein K2X55_04830 [Burkholderiaceae bacterium]|nr:hypothetical protein [Burkholderiaceae bacterium]